MIFELNRWVWTGDANFRVIDNCSDVEIMRSDRGEYRGTGADLTVNSRIP